MKGGGGGEIIGIKWMCQCVDRLTTQLGKLVSICSMVLFNETNKKVKCNMVIDWFTTNYMGAIMLLFLAVGEVLFWCLQIATVSSVVGGCLWPWSETHVGNSFASFGESPAGCYFLQLRNAELICSQVCLPIEWKIINYKSHYLNKIQFCVHLWEWNSASRNIDLDGILDSATFGNVGIIQSCLQWWCCVCWIVHWGSM